MSFKEQIKEDLDNILFNEEEFADIVTINDSKQIKAIFFSKSEIKDNEFSTFAPCFLVKKEDAQELQIDDKITYNNTTYYISEIVYVDTYTTKLFISTDNRYHI